MTKTKIFTRATLYASAVGLLVMPCVCPLEVGVIEKSGQIKLVFDIEASFGISYTGNLGISKITVGLLLSRTSFQQFRFDTSIVATCC